MKIKKIGTPIDVKIKLKIQFEEAILMALFNDNVTKKKKPQTTNIPIVLWMI